MIDHQVYLLAAGRGSRSGGPKAWQSSLGEKSRLAVPPKAGQEFDGRPLLDKQMDFLLGLFQPGSVAVSIQADWLERCRKIHAEVRWVAVAPEATPMGALVALLKASPLVRWGFVYHVDMPLWEPRLFEALAKRIPSSTCPDLETLAPSHGGRKGHPVLVSPKLQGTLLALDPAKDRLDHWLRTRKGEAVEVPYTCIHENWNQPVRAA